ncbi:MAG: hypothetical protein J07HN6_01432 [Halonotius sp. J07HN6]|nr:MAG: hypothetical protein J07HN6_01432 [Halonotius sp. J07HN6]ERH05309.1 MAG: hypothetical protein J07HN4v3_00904 [Halonotius sp. J07HN4]
MRYERGYVVVAADPLGDTPRRPYVIVSDDSHPFAGRQYIALGISTQGYEASIPLAGSFIEGELNRDSFVSPWAVVSLRTTHIDRAVAQVSTAVTDRATQQMAAYAGYHPTE